MVQRIKSRISEFTRRAARRVLESRAVIATRKTARYVSGGLLLDSEETAKAVKSVLNKLNERQGYGSKKFDELKYKTVWNRFRRSFYWQGRSVEARIFDYLMLSKKYNAREVLEMVDTHFREKDLKISELKKKVSEIFKSISDKVTQAMEIVRTAQRKFSETPLTVKENQVFNPQNEVRNKTLGFAIGDIWANSLQRVYDGISEVNEQLEGIEEINLL